MRSIEEIIDDFSFAEEWEDKYTYLIELGDSIPALAPGELSDENKVPGCMSQVWVVYDKIDDKFFFRSSSDASIVRGLAAIISAIFSGKTRQEILDTKTEEYFDKMDILEHISPNRRNGLFSMSDLIKQKVKQQLPLTSV